MTDDKGREPTDLLGLAESAARASGPNPPVAKPKGWNVDLGGPVGAPVAHLGDPCLYCETPARLVHPGPCPKAGDYGAAILSLHRNLERNVNATRIALEKATVAIGTACHDDVKATLAETRRDLAEVACEVTKLTREQGRRLALSEVPAEPEGDGFARLSKVVMLHRCRRPGDNRPIPIQAEHIIAAMDGEALNLGMSIDRLKAEVDTAHRNRQRAQDEADRLRKETMTLAEQAGLAEAKVSIAGAKAGGAFDREAALKDRLLKALAERDEARVEAEEARAKVEELEVQFSEEQDANDAEEADAKAARAALEAAQADFAKLAGVVARFTRTRPVGLPEAIAAIEQMGQKMTGTAHDLIEAEREAEAVGAVKASLKSSLDECLRQRADLEARLVAAEGKAATGGDPDAAARLVTDLTTALGERDAARAALAERDARRGQPTPLGWTASVVSDTARLVRAIEGTGVAIGRGTTYGRAAEVVEHLRRDLEQARAMNDKLTREVATMGTRVAQAESRVRDATIEVQVHRGGLRAIAEERARQMRVEGFDAAHDDKHAAGEMAWAAACYAAPGRVLRTTAYGAEDAWPWAPEWDKRPTLSGNAFEDHGVRTRALAKAGALIAAELDRLDRALPF